jgi:hypothetical protein
MSATGLGRVKTLLHDTDPRGSNSGYRIPINLGKFYGHSTRTHLTQRRGSFTRPMNRNGARRRPYHALTAASSGFIPTMFSTRVRL